ncbi:MAG: hypothetical protein ACFFBV_13585 [Promethearchaeota archaeon]
MLNSKDLEISGLKSNNSKLKKILILILSLGPISFLMKYVSEWTHEFLGHCGIGFLVGGEPISYYVSWIWPLEFGYALVSFPIGTSNISKALTASGGIITCLIAAISCNITIYFVLRKKKFKSNILYIMFHIVFWYGFWAFMNSTGYLLIGSLLNFGDIQNIANYAQISHWIFLIPGFLALILIYYLISINVGLVFKPILKLKGRWILFIFWLLIPLIFVLFSLNPSIAISLNLFFIIFPLMFIPSIISLFISNRVFSYFFLKTEIY